MTKYQRREWRRTGSISKFAAGVAVGVSLSCAIAAAAQGSGHDGTFWSRLGDQDKTLYVAGYSDATQLSLGKLDTLKVAAGVFHWKGADKILPQVERGMDISTMSGPALIGYLDKFYSNPRYGDLEVSNAIELAATRAIDAPSLPSKDVPVNSARPEFER
jgi:hypothetical protein